MQLPRSYLEKLFWIRIGKHDAEQVAETISWGSQAKREETDDGASRS